MKRKYNNEISALSTNNKSFSNKKENDQELFIRNTEHIDGNWPSHIYLKGNYKLINDISSICIKHHTLASKHSELNEMISIDDPHISLSKPFVLRSHQIVPFVKLLNQTLQNLYSFNVEIQSQYKLLRNEYNTRLFLALPLYDLHGMMTKLIKKVDHCLEQYQQPVYYLFPLYHISIASISLNPHTILPMVNSDDFITTLSKEDIDNIIELNDTNQLLQHEKNSAIISESYNNDDDDDDYNWQESIQKHHRKTRYFKQSCSISEMYSNISNANRNVTSNISLITTNKTTVASLLTDYESDDDNNNDNNATNITAKEAKTAVAEAGLYRILTINSIECKIGNKIFRLLLPNANHVEDIIVINQKNIFIEM